jgi:hypothetical protein
MQQLAASDIIKGDFLVRDSEVCNVWTQQPRVRHLAVFALRRR